MRTTALVNYGVYTAFVAIFLPSCKPVSIERHRLSGESTPDTIVETGVDDDPSSGGGSSVVTIDPITAFTLGQTSPVAADHYESYSLDRPQSVYSDGTRLFVADSGRNRILVYNAIPSSNFYGPPDFVLGQPDHLTFTVNSGGLSASSLNNPSFVYGDGTRLYVADTGNNRVLIWNSVPTTSYAPADVVVGQSDFFSDASATTQTGLYSPSGLHTDGTRLFVSDSGNHRVLIFESIPTANGAGASKVLGQANFTSNTAYIGSQVARNTMYNPQQICSSGSRLYVNQGEGRTLIFNDTTAIDDFADADLVLGQTLFTSATANSGGRDMTSLGRPTGIYCDASRLIITEGVTTYNQAQNRRVLIWNSPPTQNDQGADVLLGQDDPTVNIANNTSLQASGRMYSPMGVFFDGVRVFIADPGNRRIMIYNNLPATNGQPADIIMGTPNENNMLGSYLTDRLIDSPAGGFLYNGRYFLIDGSRILIWHSVDNVDLQPADIVLGQPDFYSRFANAGSNVGNGIVGGNTLKTPSDIHFDGTKLYVADGGNNRILIWNSFPNSNFQAADVVLGQADFVSSAVNRGGAVSGDTLYSPSSVFVMAGRLYVADRLNYRVLVWNSIPTSNGAPADFAIGQGDLNSNNSAPTSGAPPEFIMPMSIAGDGNKLLVADSLVQRILIWNTAPVNSVLAATADVVIGQSDFNSMDYLTVSATSVTSALLSVFNGKLFVADINSRVLVFNEIPTSNLAAADYVFGQLDFTSNDPGRSATEIAYPRKVAVDASRVFIPDYGNRRVLVVPNNY